MTDPTLDLIKRLDCFGNYVSADDIPNTDDYERIEDALRRAAKAERGEICELINNAVSNLEAMGGENKAAMISFAETLLHEISMRGIGDSQLKIGVVDD